MLFQRLFYLRLLFLAYLLATVPGLMGQSAGTGALTGTVTDPSNATVPGVMVTITNTETGQARAPGRDGTYRFTLLPPGTYRVKFSAMGFRPEEVPSVIVNVTETPVLNRTLQVGTQSEAIEVQAEAAVLQTANSTLGTVVGSKTVTDLFRATGS